MKCTLLFNSVLFAALSSLALARNDCNDITSYLDGKGVLKDEDGDIRGHYSELIQSCGMNNKGVATDLEMYTYCLSEKDVNKVISYGAIENLTLDSSTSYHSIGIEGLRSCGESDFFPSGLSKLQNLKSLDLFGIGTYKKGDITSLPKSLEKLSLSHSNVPQFVINEIGQSSNIEELIIYDTRDTIISKLDLSPLTKTIKKLKISHDDHSSVHKKDYLSASMIKKLNNNKVSSLTLEYYVINQKGFDNLMKYFPNLKELVFDHCSFDENVNLSSLKKQTKLTTLEFNSVYGYCDETYTVFGEACPAITIPEFVYSMTTLKRLNVHGQINPHVNLIGNLKNLEYLDLSYTNLEELPSGIYKLNNLKHLGLKSNNLKKISSKIENLKNLEFVDVVFNDDLTSVPYYLCTIKNFDYDGNRSIKKICSSKPKTTTTTKVKTTTKAKTTKKSTTTTKTKSKTTTKVPTSTVDGKCGEGYGACQSGYCCSQWGYCGTTSAYCGTGCQSGYGKCN